MMKSLLQVLLMLLCIPVLSQSAISDAERESLVSYLNQSQKDLVNTLNGLSDHQLNFKPDEESWSIAEVVEHLALSEAFIFGLAEGAIENESDIQSGNLSDEQVKQIIVNRENKVKTQPGLEPSDKFDSYKSALDEFKNLRKKHIKYLKTTQQDLRHHYFEFPFGVADAYQVLVFMSGHCERHTKQIREIMAVTGFPNS